MPLTRNQAKKETRGESTNRQKSGEQQKAKRGKKAEGKEEVAAGSGNSHSGQPREQRQARTRHQHEEVESKENGVDEIPAKSKGTQNEDRVKKSRKEQTLATGTEAEKNKELPKETKGRKRHTTIKISSKGSAEETCACGLDHEEGIWILCDNCFTWWFADCALIPEEVCKIYEIFNLPYRCAFCVRDKIEGRELLGKQGKTGKKKELNTATLPDRSDKKQKEPKEQEKRECMVEEEKIVIIDNIRVTKNYRDSETILKEVNVYKPKAKVKWAYQLPRGGIALHAKTTEDKQELLEKWPEKAFGESDISTHSTSKTQPHPKCILKNTDKTVSNSEVEYAIEQQTGVKAKVRRLYYTDTGRPLPIVVVETRTHEELTHILTKKVKIADRVTKPEAYISKASQVIRCYRCQAYGHIASLCSGEVTCVKCGGKHGTDTHCRNSAKCANCGKKHWATSKACESFIEQKANIDKRRQQNSDNCSNQK
ncbi:uncharacterized protein LOC144860427 [Branchiostoma floridae x Branchiostoma japonicum]